MIKLKGYQYVFLLFQCTKQLLTAINNKVKSTLDSTPALYYEFLSSDELWVDLFDWIKSKKY